MLAFEEFFRNVERPLRFALAARFGFDVGSEATSEALVYAWENWERIGGMERPDGYVYRVGERVGRRLSNRREPVDLVRAEGTDPLVEPGLPSALAGLTGRQRTVVILVHALGWTQSETAEFLSLSTSSVQRHLERGMKKLRRELGVRVE